ncbi:unnamed protein product, partial [Amoebophrya sp. A25]
GLRPRRAFFSTLLPVRSGRTIEYSDYADLLNRDKCTALTVLNQVAGLQHDLLP